MNKKIHLLRSHTWGLIVLLFLSCQMKTYTLKNGKTKVPVNPSAYKNKSKFDASLLKSIDTVVIYEEYSLERNILLRLDNNPVTRFYGVYRFYSNGCFNYFTIDREAILDTNSFNPAYDGNRGVYYKVENQIKGDLFARSNEIGWIDSLPRVFTFSGDTLYSYNNLNKQTRTFLKRELPDGYLNYSANW